MVAAFGDTASAVDLADDNVLCQAEIGTNVGGMSEASVVVDGNDEARAVRGPIPGTVIIRRTVGHPSPSPGVHDQIFQFARSNRTEQGVAARNTLQIRRFSEDGVDFASQVGRTGPAEHIPSPLHHASGCRGHAADPPACFEPPASNGFFQPTAPFTAASRAPAHASHFSQPLASF